MRMSDGSEDNFIGRSPIDYVTPPTSRTPRLIWCARTSLARLAVCEVTAM
jgi:hypothetical protein